MGKARKAIKEDRYPKFVCNFFNTLYHGDKQRYPKWAVDALNSVGINLLEGQGDMEAKVQVVTAGEGGVALEG